MMMFIESLNGLQDPYRLVLAYGLIALVVLSLLALFCRYRRSFAWYRDIISYYQGRRLRVVHRRGKRRYVFLGEIQKGDHCTGIFHPPSSRWLKKHGQALAERLRGAVDESLRVPPLSREPEQQDETWTESRDAETQEKIYRLASRK